MSNTNEASVAQETFDHDYRIRTDGKIHLSPLNLDAMPDYDLRIASEHPALHADIRRHAASLCETRRLRLAGEVAQAARIERRLDALYMTYPVSVRW